MMGFLYNALHFVILRRPLYSFLGPQITTKSVALHNSNVASPALGAQVSFGSLPVSTGLSPPHLFLFLFSFIRRPGCYPGAPRTQAYLLLSGDYSRLLQALSTDTVTFVGSGDLMWASFLGRRHRAHTQIGGIFSVPERCTFLPPHQRRAKHSGNF